MVKIVFKVVLRLTTGARTGIRVKMLVKTTAVEVGTMIETGTGTD
jgi:hypothetical protein